MATINFPNNRDQLVPPLPTGALQDGDTTNITADGVTITYVYKKPASPNTDSWWKSMGRTYSITPKNKIEQGNSSVEVLDSGTNGQVVVTTDGTERAKFRTDGHFVVGGNLDANPNIELTDDGNVRPTGDVRSVAQNVSSTSGVGFRCGNTGFFTAQRPSTASDSDVVFNAYKGTSENIRFQADGSATFEGNVGINCTPPADALSTYKWLNISGTGFISSTNGGYFGHEANAYLNSSSNWTYKNSAFAVSIGADASTGITYFRRAVSGTAGNTVSWNISGIIDKDGRYLIGSLPAQSTAGFGTSVFQILGNNPQRSSALFFNFAGNSSSQAIILAKRRDGDVNGGRVQDGDELGHISWQGWGGTGGALLKEAARITAEAEAPTSGKCEAHIKFSNANSSGAMTERLRIKNDGTLLLVNSPGIQFPAGTVPSNTTIDNNLLDDYEEGTFKPTFVMTTSGSVTLHSSYDTLAYTKVGRLVTITGLVRIDSVSSPVGGLRIDDLPFTSANTAGNSGRAGSACTYWDNSAGPGDKYLNRPCVVYNNSTQLFIPLNNTDLTPAASDEIIFSMSYFHVG